MLIIQFALVLIVKPDELNLLKQSERGNGDSIDHLNRAGPTKIWTESAHCGWKPNIFKCKPNKPDLFSIKGHAIL